MTQRSLVMIRKDGIPFRDEIQRRIESVARIVASRRYDGLPAELIQGLYAEHKGKPFYQWLVDYHIGEPAEVLILEGEDNLFELINGIVGATNPAEAKPGTIRRDFSDDDMTISAKEKRMVRNVIHRSRTLEDAAREAYIVFGQELDNIKP